MLIFDPKSCLIWCFISTITGLDHQNCELLMFWTGDLTLLNLGFLSACEALLHFFCPRWKKTRSMIGLGICRCPAYAESFFLKVAIEQMVSDRNELCELLVFGLRSCNNACWISCRLELYFGARGSSSSDCSEGKDEGRRGQLMGLFQSLFYAWNLLKPLLVKIGSCLLRWSPARCEDEGMWPWDLWRKNLTQGDHGWVGRCCELKMNLPWTYPTQRCCRIFSSKQMGSAEWLSSSNKIRCRRRRRRCQRCLRQSWGVEWLESLNSRSSLILLKNLFGFLGMVNSHHCKSLSPKPTQAEAAF